MDVLVDFSQVLKRNFYTKTEDESNFDTWLSQKTKYTNGNMTLGDD